MSNSKLEFLVIDNFSNDLSRAKKILEQHNITGKIVQLEDHENLHQSLMTKNHQNNLEKVSDTDLIKKIYLFEDDTTIRELIEVYLEMSSYEVKAFTGYSEEVVVNEDFNKSDFFVIDLNLPGESGIELSKNIRKQMPNSKIVLMSGYYSETNKLEIENLGLDYLVKPFEIDELVKLIEKLGE